MLVDLLVASAANRTSVLGCYVVTSPSQLVLMLPSLCKSPSEIDADIAAHGRAEAFYFAIRIDRTIPIAGRARTINARGEMMNLTDMWKAAGKPSGRAPADWREVNSTVEFVALFAANAGPTGISFVTRRGTNGGTFAHWQIGLAYTKYLSPRRYVRKRCLA